MGILESIMRKREQTAAYRTVDGGHPAPYPDMTDEQLYNYEMAFNVPKKTFSQPPSSVKQKVASTSAWRDPREPYLEEPFVTASLDLEAPSMGAEHRTSSAEAKSGSHRDAQSAAPNASSVDTFKTEEPPSSQLEEEEPPLFDISTLEPAPFTAPEPDLPPLDFNRPLRTITTHHPVEIITTRARHPIYKVHAYLGNDEVATVFTIDGRLSETGPRFLENVPQRETLFLNVYAMCSEQTGEKFTLTQHVSREEADANAQPGRLACVPIEFDR